MSDDEGRELDPKVEEKRRRVIEPMDFETLRREPAFERISRAIRALLGVSMANVSVMEDERQCVVGKVGFERDHFARDQSFCAYALSSRDLEVVEDAHEDERFSSNPYVLEAPYIRFYAGVPLEVQGIPVGSLCALDDEPRQLGARDEAVLRELARLVERFLVTKVVADSEDDPRYRLAAELTSTAGLAAILDSELTGGSELGSVVGELKECVDTGYDAIEDWVEEEHEASFEE